MCSLVVLVEKEKKKEKKHREWELLKTTIGVFRVDAQFAMKVERRGRLGSEDNFLNIH